ncbi:monosaccharide ABC transporter ATP-binding protein, CUT2 family [Desulfosporosinus acidiphilus SJ4]|uniref:Monosaccharide ABC transporter ATP-binding protein, CUT2 family n=1 Tax=Desulfosporosinus acidiphilus (strain DSM 22704 / JCM 16185 / SJ4) TaxID=646529 RepID=I4D7C4_DESAJ|nr:sugar ABC transporter ATP-binding protein [Desulfosporosinus acidiphilus]AFM41698.1 monosaccharide ABC transporter ATP-binding protein, CUT2 family [Desulfosporosinus acidiphilus SJ4]
MASLEMKGICKAFSGVKVLQGVDLHINGGEVVALLGENGAGKSTLMKILTGVYVADEGQTAIDGEVVSIRGIRDAQNLGIEMIYQELNLFPNLSVAENFLIGHEDEFRKMGFVNYPLLYKKVEETMATLNLNRSPKEPLGGLSVGEQQLVEIGKALQKDVRFLIMDEPTSALSRAETERLFEIVRSLKAKGVGIIYISHRLEELFTIADRVTVLRDGQFIATVQTKETTERELVSLMVGREIEERYPHIDITPSDRVLLAEHLSTESIHDVSLEVKAGEIVGLGGLMGAGRTEVARALSGIDALKSGEISLEGRTLSLKSPLEAIRAGIALVTEDRKNEGLHLPFSIRENLALPTLGERSRFGLIQRQGEQENAQHWVKQLRVKTPTIEQLVQNLSGGNQQKVVIGKWLACNPKLLILDEPTRGVDVGAKQEIYQLMNHLKSEGKAVLLISSDLPELLGMSDRVYVMHEGVIKGELLAGEMQQEAFMSLATGGEV